MTKKEYLAKRKVLLDEAEALLNEGKLEDFAAKEQEIKDLDAKYEEIAKAQANMNALKDSAVVPPDILDNTGRVVVGDNRESKKPWNSFGEFLVAVRSAAEPGLQPNDWDPRLKWTNAASGIGRTPADGGFLVQHDVATEIISNGYEQSQLAPLCRKVPIGENSDGLSVNVVDETSRATGSRWGGVQVYWRNEGDTVTATKPKFKRLDLPLEDLMGLCYATREMMRDETQLGAIVKQAFSEEIAWTMDDCIMNGTGVGKPLGYLKSPALVTVAKENAQNAKTIVTRNLSKMWARLWARSRKNAIWIINQDIEPELDELAIAVGTAGIEPRFVTYGPDGVLRIKGRPVMAMEQAATLGTVGDISLVDLSQYVLIDKDNVEMAESMHVRFVYGEDTFRFMYRVNGQPYWTRPITPANGSNDQSPYVALATRA